MDTDRNLLFGVITMQAGLIDASQFVEICSHWAVRKDTPLADLLEDRGWITQQDRTHLEYLLGRRIEKHAGDVQASLAGVPAAIRRSLAGIGDSSIQQSLARMEDDSPDLAATQIFVAESCDTLEDERYELSEFHAEGGMGRVWRARDKTLDRVVALKELKPDLADQRVLRARFHREAKLTGQLEHPGIVPVYDFVSRPPDTRSFYTMRFLNGRTLAQATRELHHDRATGVDIRTGLLELPRDKIIGRTDHDIGLGDLAEKYRQDDLEVMRSRKRKEVVEENHTAGMPMRLVHTVKTPV